MAADTNIEWAHATFNPVRGCSKVSAGCANCYAEALSKRNPAVLGEWGDGGTRVIASESYWRQPLAWNAKAKASGRPFRVFCASLADVFEDRPELVAPRARLFALIESTPHLTWMLLTKRPEQVLAMVPIRAPNYGVVRLEHEGKIISTRNWHAMNGGFPPNVWIGASVENQEAAEARIPHLLEIPARVRFLSCEPLLGPVDLRSVVMGDCDSLGPGLFNHGLGRGIDWVIAGGESGPNARPMHPSWARSLRDQCQAARVPFFFKQWGEWIPYDEWRKSPPDENGPTFEHIGDDRIAFVSEHGPGREDWASERLCKIARVGKRAAGRLLDGREWSEFPKEDAR